METGRIYHEVLIGIYRDYKPKSLPLWVKDGLMEEGFAERDEIGRLRLTEQGAAFSASMNSDAVQQTHMA